MRYSVEEFHRWNEVHRQEGIEQGKRVALELVRDVLGLTGYDDETTEFETGWVQYNNFPPGTTYSRYTVYGWSRLYSDLEAAREATRGAAAVARIHAALPKATK